MAILTELRRYSATELRDQIADGTLTPAELMEQTLNEVDRNEPRLSAFISLLRDDAMKTAQLMSRRPPDRLPPLFGLPFTVKDTIEVAGVRATAGSRLLADYVPAKNASVVDKIIQAGAILIGKTNCAEFGIGNLETCSPVRGQTRNPWDLARSPGGSSGGDSAALASGMSTFGVGTDYGGSVRFPAHCSGISALRPTPGRLAGDGMIPQQMGTLLPVRPSRTQRDLQTAGFLARSVKDLRLLLNVTTGYRHEASSRLGCAWFVDDVDADVARTVADAAKVLQESGLPVTAMEPFDVQRASRLLAELRDAEGLPEIAWLSAGRMDDLSPLVREQVIRPITPAREGLALEIAQMRSQARSVLDKWPVLLMPVAATPAFLIEPDRQPDRSRLDLCTRMVTLLRLPSVVVPCGTSEGGLPIGVQIAAREGHDEDALAIANTLETAFGRWNPTNGTRK